MGAEVAWASLLKRFEDEAGDSFEGEIWEQELLLKLAVSMGIKKKEFSERAMEGDIKDAFFHCWRNKFSREQATERLAQARKAMGDERFEQARELYEQVLAEKSFHIPSILLEYVTLCRMLNAECLEKALFRAAATNDDECMRRLIVFLLQEDRHEEALPWLKRGGWKIRLCAKLFNYGGERECTADVPLRVFDDALPPDTIQYLRDVIDDGFFRDHEYNIAIGCSSRCGFFSYRHDLRGTHTLDRIFAHLRDTLLPTFPGLAKARFAEWWTHMRPHSAYHQLHFDSDDEGIRGVRNPVLTVVLYLRADAGGPTLVTSQRKDNVHVSYCGAHGWLAYPKVNRLVAFVGNLLHGVLPGKGKVDPSCRRHSFMVSFWEDVERRAWDGPGSCRDVCECPMRWIEKARRPCELPPWSPKEIKPLEAARIWENIDGSAISNELELHAQYCFQF